MFVLFTALLAVLFTVLFTVLLTVLFVVLFIEECYAQVVEVEADDGGYVPEPFAMAVQVVEHQNGVVANVFEDTVSWFCE